MSDQTNPTLKFNRLPDAQVVELLNNRAVDAQWDVNNAKSPKGKRDAQDDLNLFASAIELLKKNNLNLTINIQKLVERIDLTAINAADAKEQITNMLINAVQDAQLAVQ